MKEIRIKTLTELLTEPETRLKKQELCTFFCALAAGLAAHLFQYTNKLYNYDDLSINPGGYGTGTESGRWFLQFMGEWMNDFLGNYSLPLFNGLFALILLSFSALLITRMFGIKDMVLSGFVGIFFVVMPSVVCMNFFMFTAGYYAVGIFFSVLSGYLMVMHGKNIILQILAIFFLSCAVGTYQAYFPNTASILVLSVILTCAYSDRETTVKDIILMAVRYVVSLALGMIGYFVGMRLSLLYWNVPLGGYRGIENIGGFQFSQLPRMIGRCYYSFLWFCKNNMFDQNPTAIVKGGILLMYAVSAALTVYVIIKKRKDTGKLVLLVLSLLAYPVAVFLIYLMAGDVWIYAIMVFPMVFIYVFILIWLDRGMEAAGTPGQRLCGRLMHWGISVSAIAITIVYLWYANGNYQTMWYTQQHDMAYFQTMVTQIKSAEGYRDGLPFAVIGERFEDSSHMSGSMYEAEFSMGGRMESNINSYSRWHIMIQYLGYNPQFLFAAETDEIAKWPEVQEMAEYPENGSIRIINDVIVIKLSEREEETE